MNNTVRTTISLRKSLFDQAEAIAQDMGLARSQVFALAMEEFIQRRKHQRLLEQLNAAYADEEPDPEEEARLRAMLHSFRKLVDGEW